MKPTFPFKGMVLGDLTSNIDFERTALTMPPGLDRCLPDPDQVRACIMRGHDGSFHSEDIKTARRHNAFHDLLMPQIANADRACNMYGIRGKFKPIGDSLEARHNGMVFDAERYHYMLKTHYVDKSLGCLVQKPALFPTSIRAFDYTKPTAPPLNSQEIHTSWLQSIARFWTPDGTKLVKNNEVVYQDGVMLHGPDNGTYGKNKYIEIMVNFFLMGMGGHRGSHWFMPVVPNTAYDANKINGTEIDLFEHEVTNNEEFSKKCFMKCLGGHASVGNTVNEIPFKGPDINGGERARGHLQGAIHFDDINENKWHTFGLSWEQNDDGTEGRVRMSRNGVEVVRDSILTPIDTLMYMILSREANVDHGLSGENIYDYLDRIDSDKFLTRHIRAWDIKNPMGSDISLKETGETFKAPTPKKGNVDLLNIAESFEDIAATLRGMG